MWLLEQDAEFNNWYHWLLEIFNEANFAIKKNFLTNIFSHHQKFLQRLMKGYVPKNIESKTEIPKPALSVIDILKSVSS